jgi:photoactive yellow protein
MSEILPLTFDHADVCDRIEAFRASELDDLDFGVIGFDAETVVRLYNTLEAKISGLSPHRVVGHPLFTVVAPCMNNFMVAQRFEDAAASGIALDAIIDYVLTLRMRPVKVKLRLLAAPGQAMRYLLVNRAA